MTQTFTTDDNFTAISGCTVDSGSVTADTGYGNATLDALDSDLSHLYKFDSGANLTDSIGSADLTNSTAVAFSSGKNGDAATFDGTGDYLVNSGGIFGGASQALISLWIKPDLTSNFRPFYEDNNDGTVRAALSISVTGAIYFVFDDGSPRNISGGNGTISTDTWQHVMCYLDVVGNTQELYVDGVQVASGTRSGTLTDDASSTGFMVGKYGTDADTKGQIDEVAVWLDATPADVGAFASALYNSGSGRFYDAEGDGQFTVHDASVDYIDAGSGYTQDFSEFANTLTGSPAITYQYYQSNNSGDTPTYSGTWLTLAQLQAVTDTALRYMWLKVRIRGGASDSFEELTGDVGSTDLTPPSDVTSIASSIHGSGPYDLVAFFTGGTDTGGSGYAGANLEIEVGGVSYFQQSDGSFSTSETFADLLLKGDASTRDIIYAIQYASLPTRFRLNVWDNAENYNRGDWDTFSNPAATPPGAPAITTATAGDGSVTLTLTAAEETDLIYARYRTPDSGWSSESGTFSRTGSGEIEITGLANGTIHIFSTYAKSGSLTSDWSAAAHAVPGLSTGAVIGDIAQAVTDYLNATDLSLPFTAERTYLPLFDRKDMDNLHVTVVPVEISEEGITRDKAALRVKVDVAIQQAVDAEDTAAVDGLVAFALEVATTLRGVDLIDAEAQWVEQTHEPAYDLDGLRERRQFISLITATYVTYKEAA